MRSGLFLQKILNYWTKSAETHLTAKGPLSFIPFSTRRTPNSDETNGSYAYVYLYPKKYIFIYLYPKDQRVPLSFFSDILQEIGCKNIKKPKGPPFTFLGLFLGHFLYGNRFSQFIFTNTFFQKSNNNRTF